jgi:hypothetical protein
LKINYLHCGQSAYIFYFTFSLINYVSKDHRCLK